MYVCYIMPNLTIYLNTELYEQVKDDASKLVQAALEVYFEEYCPKCKKKIYACKCIKKE